jgi:hypothetical protein
MKGESVTCLLRCMGWSTDRGVPAYILGLVDNFWFRYVMARLNNCRAV